MNEQPRTIPIHTSLIRPILLMGAERELVLISGIHRRGARHEPRTAALYRRRGRLLGTEPCGAATRGEIRSAVQPRLSAPHALSRVLRRAVARYGTRFFSAGGHAVLALREFRSTAKGLPDLLNYAAVVDDGVVLNKDGSLTAAWAYRGEDLDSASVPELSALSARVNAAFARRGSGWMVHVDALRTEARGYPDVGRLSRSHDAAHRRRAARRLRGRRRALRKPLRAGRHLPPADRRAARDRELLRRGRPATRTRRARRHGRWRPLPARLWISRITCPRRCGWCACAAAASRIRLAAGTSRTSCSAT